MLYLPELLRPVYRNIDTGGRGIILPGARGVGKTTFILHYLKNNEKKEFLYFSADNPLLTSIPLYDMIDAVFMEGYEGVFIDEVHFVSNWASHLKAIYDAFPEKRCGICQ